LAGIHIRRAGPTQRAVPVWSFSAPALPPKVDLPAPPESILRPQAPDLPSDPAAEVLLRPAPVKEPVPLEVLSPSPVAFDPVAHSAFVRSNLAPLLQNRDQFRRRMSRVYENQFRRWGVEGTVDLKLLIDVHGKVLQAMVDGSSGYERLDEAARRAAKDMEFWPALDRDQSVGLWVNQRICFVLDNRRRYLDRECAHMVR